MKISLRKINEKSDHIIDLIHLNCGTLLSQIGIIALKQGATKNVGCMGKSGIVIPDGKYINFGYA